MSKLVKNFAVYKRKSLCMDINDLLRKIALHIRPVSHNVLQPSAGIATEGPMVLFLILDPTWRQIKDV